MPVLPFRQYCSSPGPAVGALPAGVDHAADADAVADRVPGDPVADLGDDADDLVADDHAGSGSGPTRRGRCGCRSGRCRRTDLDQHVLRADVRARWSSGRGARSPEGAAYALTSMIVTVSSGASVDELLTGPVGPRRDCRAFVGRNDGPAGCALTDRVRRAAQREHAERDEGQRSQHGAHERRSAFPPRRLERDFGDPGSDGGADVEQRGAQRRRQGRAGRVRWWSGPTRTVVISGRRSSPSR